MSNLYKQWFVRTETEHTRVIDSDAIMSEFLKKNVPSTPAPKAEQQSADGEFAEGLATAGNVLKSEPETDYVQLAKEEAKEILSEARREADGILVRAEAEKAEIEKQAQEKGYSDGQAQLQQELNRLRTELEVSYDEKKQELDAQYTKERANMENELVDVILEVFNKVFHIQFDSKKEILMHLINNAILNIEDEKKFRVKVAESNVIFLENHREEILDRVGHDIELEIVADFSLDENNCIIETASGIFDCSLGVQLENLIKDIRSLCS